jgi:hypothetical protein
MSIQRLVLLMALLGCPAGCQRHRTVLPQADAAPPPGRFSVVWSPATGRGEVSERLSSGDVMHTCFHCAYPGYTGGLVIGNFSAPGMELRPQKPLRGYDSINVFCAQDESIWDLDEQVEYSYGWSENFGTGPDGKRLEYVRGRVLEHDDTHVVLTSENAGGCYQVTKVATTRAEWRYWMIATRIENRCTHPVHFDFHSGDDPWIGRYASADGDVGWTPAGLINNEKGLTAGAFTAGGLYDLGNRKLGQTDAGFSNQANFFALDPALPLPDFTGFANRFAHHQGEIDEKRPLENRTMIALNMGWRNRRLAPAESMMVALALGLAATGEPGSIPQLPAIDDAAWSTWRHHLSSLPESDDVLFASEKVELSVTDGHLAVSAEYHLRNASPDGQGLTIAYPIIVSRGLLPPEEVVVDERALPAIPLPPGRVYARFPISIPAHEIRSFRVRYQQRLRRREAVYLVTSALSWALPIESAVFVIKHPSRWRNVTLSYPVSHRETANGQTTLYAVMQPFQPDHEIVVHWDPD